MQRETDQGDEMWYRPDCYTTQYYNTRVADGFHAFQRHRYPEDLMGFKFVVDHSFVAGCSRCISGQPVCFRRPGRNIKRT